MAENAQYKYPKLLLDLFLACVLGNLVFFILWPPISPELSFPIYDLQSLPLVEPNQRLLVWGLPALSIFSIQNYLSIFLAVFCGSLYASVKTKIAAGSSLKETLKFSALAGLIALVPAGLLTLILKPLGMSIWSNRTGVTINDYLWELGYCCIIIIPIAWLISTTIGYSLAKPTPDPRKPIETTESQFLEFSLGAKLLILLPFLLFFLSLGIAAVKGAERRAELKVTQEKNKVEIINKIEKAKERRIVNKNGDNLGDDVDIDDLYLPHELEKLENIAKLTGTKVEDIDLGRYGGRVASFDKKNLKNLSKGYPFDFTSKEETKRAMKTFLELDKNDPNYVKNVDKYIEGFEKALEQGSVSVEELLFIPLVLEKDKLYFPN